MSEHTDAARLEATRDAIRTGTAPRPRVEGEVVTPEELDERAWMIRDMGFEGTRRDLKRAAGTIRSLTAEVERLTEYAAKGDALHDLAVKVWADDKEAVVVQLAESREANAALRAEVERLRGIALNLSAAWYYGGWKYETINEREMQSLMEQAGYWPTTEEQIIERRAALALPTPAPEATNDGE